jgi:predicted nucleic acid-binding protein
MLVVADSSPLNVLVALGYVEILPKLFQTVVIPTQVANELSHHRTPIAVRNFIASPPSWLQVRIPRMVEPIPTLDPGEEAAISLAREINADLLLIDDSDGRKAAVQRHLAVIGTIGILERAALGKLLDLKQAIDRIRRTDFRVSDEFLNQTLQRHADRSSSSAKSKKPL